MAVRDPHDQAGLGDSRVAMGLAVWLRVDGIDVVVNSIRTQTFAPDAFTGLGVDLGDKRLIAVKSSHHFQGHFAPLADRIIHCATPGAIQMDFAEIPYVKRGILILPARRRPAFVTVRVGAAALSASRGGGDSWPRAAIRCDSSPEQIDRTRQRPGAAAM